MRRNCIRLVYRLPSGAIISNRHSPPTRRSIDFVSTLKPAGPNHTGRWRGSAQAENTNSRGALITRERTISRSSAQVDRGDALLPAFADIGRLVLFQFLYVHFQSIQSLLPDLPLSSQPNLDGCERFRLQGARPDAPALFGRHQAAALQNADVFHQARQRHFEWLRQLADRCLACTQPHHDRPTGCVGKGPENLAEPRGLVSHEANYSGCT